MLLPTDLPNGWNHFVARYWESSPRLFPSLLQEPASLSQLLFDAACAAVENNPPQLRFVATDMGFVAGNADRHSRPPIPMGNDTGFEGYLIRAAAESRSRDVSFILKEAQASSVRLFNSCINFLSGLLELLGTPLETEAVIFATRSQISALGIHRDPYSNFIFVAQGEKTFLLWPRSAVPGEPVSAPPSALTSLRQSAEAIHLRAGDVLYLPSGYYHCAVQDGFSVHLSIVLSTAAERATQKFFQRQMEQFFRNSFDDTEGANFFANPINNMFIVPPSIRRSLRRTLAKTRRAEEAILLELLRTQSAAGFWSVPAERRRGVLLPSDWVSAGNSHLRLLTVGSDILIAARGHLYHYPAHPLVIEMIETLVTGKPIKIADLLRRFTGTARIGREKILLESRWIRLLLSNLYKARWLKKISPKGLQNRSRIS